MKLGLISDIHSNLVALEEVLARLKDVDRIFCAGDIVGYNPWPNEVIELIREDDRIVSVMGNHDLAVLTGDVSFFNPIAARAVLWTRERLTRDNIEFLRNLPKKLELELEGMRIFLCHGSPADPIDEYVFPNVSDSRLRFLISLANSDILVMGHTHVPMLRFIDERLVLNPGSVGQPRDFDPRASFAVLELPEMSVDIIRVEYDVQKVSEKILEEGLPIELAERLCYGW